MNPTKPRYWISTLGVTPLVFRLYESVPEHSFSIMFGIKECNWFTFWLFKTFKINLLAEDKFKWRRN